MYIMATSLILPPSIVPCTHDVPARQIFFLSQGKAQLLLATGLSMSLSLDLHVQRDAIISYGCFLLSSWSQLKASVKPILISKSNTTLPVTLHHIQKEYFKNCFMISKAWALIRRDAGCTQQAKLGWCIVAEYTPDNVKFPVLFRALTTIWHQSWLSSYLAPLNKNISSMRAELSSSLYS